MRKDQTIKPFLYRYEPQPDITIYELARLVAVIANRYPSVTALAAAIEALPPECRRHIVEVAE